MKGSSSLSGFYKKSVDERIETLREVAGLEEEDIQRLKEGLPVELANIMVENVVGTFQLPLGIATNFRVNGRDYLVPMATEEASVIAAASHAAKLALPEGFKAASTRPVVRGQVQIIGLGDLATPAQRILEAKCGLMEEANRFAGSLPKMGGGVVDLKVKAFEEPRRMLVAEFYVDCRDAMGANVVNTILEGIAPRLEELTGGRSLLRILSNLTTERMSRSSVVFRRGALGDEIIEGIIAAYDFACADPYRAATHNKGIMNGITAVTIATGNDSRAVEAGAHAYAAISGKYLPLSKWWKDKEGNLVGELELPLALGIVGGATKVHPVAQTVLKIIGAKSANELAEVVCAVGLAQNFAALRALVSEGIQKGHMRLHSRNVAIMAGATGQEVEKVASAMVAEGNIRVSRAKEILEALRGKSSDQ
ncbi:MAG: Hydroxymethylglutaryl-CoA reductase [Candidatus Methanosuratincola subterraneus]|uniref:3-hydroxy-3-methylglutaryl coenzyme A reductase n=1 Tax=Methanosuratincola subterraneus TaxID=2593994 RepID=A0A444L8C4_METS7|nr:MAG: Hydroxymethylglutaryl-CoA reductase [Candidatus Methanosuratincola subterraneus]